MAPTLKLPKKPKPTPTPQPPRDRPRHAKVDRPRTSPAPENPDGPRLSKRMSELFGEMQATGAKLQDAFLGNVR